MLWLEWFDVCVYVMFVVVLVDLNVCVSVCFIVDVGMFDIGGIDLVWMMCFGSWCGGVILFGGLDVVDLDFEEGDIWLLKVVVD